MQHARHGQRERQDGRVEGPSVLGDHLVGAAHGAHRRRQVGATRVLETLPGLQQGLLADDAQALAQRRSLVGDDPLPYGLARNRKALEAVIGGSLSPLVAIALATLPIAALTMAIGRRRLARRARLG